MLQTRTCRYIPLCLLCVLTAGGGAAGGTMPGGGPWGVNAGGGADGIENGGCGGAACCMGTPKFGGAAGAWYCCAGG